MVVWSSVPRPESYNIYGRIPTDNKPIIESDFLSNYNTKTIIFDILCTDSPQFIKR